MKSKIIIILVLILSISKIYSQKGLIANAVNTSDSTYSIYETNTPTATYGNRTNWIQINRTKITFKHKSFAFDSIISVNNGSVGKLLWIGTDGLLKASPKDSLFLSYNRLTNKPTLFSGAYNDLTGKPTIPTNTNELSNGSGFLTSEVDGSTTNELQTLSITSNSVTISSGNTIVLPSIAPTQTMVTRSFNSSFQPNSTHIVDVRYSVQISSTLSLSGGQSGSVFLEYSPDNSTWTTLTQSVNNNTGTLTLGLNTVQVQACQLSGMIPLNYYVRLRTSGASTFTYLFGNEITY